MARLPVAADERVDERPDLTLGAVRGGVLDVLERDVRVRPVLDRELLDLAQQALLAVADLADERLRRVAVERRAETRRLTLQPLGQLARLHRGLFADVAARGLHRLDERLGRLVAALLAREERDRRVRRDVRQRRHEVLLDVGVAEALDAVDHDDAMAHGERHRRERRGGGLGRGLVTGQDVDAGRAALALAERAQVRPALGDPAVVVAVDEIGGLE